MKKTCYLLLALVMGCIGTISVSKAQPPGIPRDSIKQIVSEIIANNNYARVPVGEYERELQLGIDSAVESRFNKIYYIGGIILVIAGGLIALNFKRILNNEVRKEIDKKLEHLDADINKQIKIFFFDNYKDINEKELKDIKDDVNGKVLKISDTLNIINEKMPDIRRMFINARIDNIKTTRSGAKVTEADFKDLKRMLKDAEELEAPELVSKIVNELSYVSYYLRKDNELESLVSQYAEKEAIKMEPTAYVNTALVLMYAYQSTGDLKDRDKAEYYLNLSLKALPDYGEPFAMKLELLMIDMDKATTAEEKNRIDVKARNLMKQICRSEVTSKEAINRFIRVQGSKAKSVYIDMLYQLYPNEMNDMLQVSKINQAVKN